MSILNSLFGSKYFEFTASSFAITGIVLVALVLWTLLTYQRRKKQMAKLEEAGLRRASKS